MYRPCPGSLSVAVIKLHDKNLFRGKRVLLGLQFQVTVCHSREITGTVSKSSQSYPQTKQRKIMHVHSLACLLLFSSDLSILTQFEAFLSMEWCPYSATHTGLGLPVSIKVIKTITHGHAYSPAQ